MGKKGRGNVNRLLNPNWASAKNAGWKLWDRQGHLWEPCAFELERPRVEELFFDPHVQVAVAEHTQAPTWVEPSDRRLRWKQEVGRRAFDPKWTWKTEGTLPLTAIEFASGDQRLLLFYDAD
jgi:hypothetical protein